jgi:hypothetical protein
MRNTGCPKKTRKFRQFPKPDFCYLAYFYRKVVLYKNLRKLPEINRLKFYEPTPQGLGTVALNLGVVELGKSEKCVWLQLGLGKRYPNNL